MGRKQSGKGSSKRYSSLDYNPEIYPIYKLIGHNGGGQLVDSMLTATKTKDFTQIDNLIKTEVVKFLINDGKGDEVINYKNKILK